MSNVGFVYILINPSLSGLVKIGKTTRTPEERAKELSDATGIPTPFIVAFDEQFEDCDYAESFMHTLLENQGYRVAGNREFFNIPLKDAIRSLIEAKNAISTLPSSNAVAQAQPSNQEQTKEAWRDVLEQANAFMYGIGDTLEDEKQAEKLYKKAVKLGSSEACVALAKMVAGTYVNDDDPYEELQYSPLTKNMLMALDYLKEAVRLGDLECYGKMAFYYFKLDSFENAVKCWGKYFDFLLSDSASVVHFREVDYNLAHYVRQVKSGNIPNMYGKHIKDITDKSFEEVSNTVKQQMDERVYKRVYNLILEDGVDQNDIQKALIQAITEGTEMCFEKLYSRTLNILFPDYEARRKFRILKNNLKGETS